MAHRGRMRHCLPVVHRDRCVTDRQIPVTHCSIHAPRPSGGRTDRVLEPYLWRTEVPCVTGKWTTRGAPRTRASRIMVAPTTLSPYPLISHPWSTLSPNSSPLHSPSFSPTTSSPRDGERQRPTVARCGPWLPLTRRGWRRRPGPPARARPPVRRSYVVPVMRPASPGSSSLSDNGEGDDNYCSAFKAGAWWL